MQAYILNIYTSSNRDGDLPPITLGSTSLDKLADKFHNYALLHRNDEEMDDDEFNDIITDLKKQITTENIIDHYPELDIAYKVDYFHCCLEDN